MPPLSTHVDNFDAGSINTALWPSQSSGSVTVSSQRLAVPSQTAGTQWIESRRVYTFDSVYARVVVPAVNGSSAAYCQMYVRPHGTDADAIFICDTVANELRFMLRTAGTPDAGWFSITYSATDHAWWQLRATGGNVLWETAPDGKTWTTRRTETAPAWVASTTEAFIQLEAGRTGGSDGTAFYDSFNTLGAFRVPVQTIQVP